MNEKKRFISLKTKIIAATLIPVVISFLCLSSVIFLSLSNSLHEAAESKFVQLSQKYAHSFESKISSAMDYLVIVASELEMQAGAGLIKRETLQEMILNVFDNYQLIDGSSVYFEPNMYDGKDTEYSGTNYGTAKTGRICWYYYMDAGQTAYLPEGLENEVEFGLPHYAGAKAENSPIYTNPVTYEIDGKDIPMFTLTYPIRNSAGEFIGAVTVDLFLDDIYAEIQNEKLYETGYAIIENDNNRLIYSPKYEDIGKDRIEAGMDYPLPLNSNEPFFFNGHSILNGKESLITVECVYIPQLNSSFYISVAAPLAEINASVYEFLTRFLIFGAMIIVAIALLLYYLIGKLSAPFTEITEGVNKIADGDYDARITGAYTGELALVKDSVNLMADSIQAHIKDSQSTLNVLKNILNGLDAYIYVTDTDTDEILFVNDKMQELSGLEGDVSGKICWQVLQEGQTQRCEACPCYQLDMDPNRQVEWEEHHTLSKRIFRNNDRYIEWVGGKKAHLQHSMDITDIKHAQYSLDRRLGQQALMAAISQSFLPNLDINAQISSALHMTGEFMDVAQILFYQVEEDDLSLTCCNEWMNAELNLTTRIGSQWHLSEAILSIVKEMNGGGMESYLSSNNPAIREAMAPYRVNFRHYITIPLFVKNRLYGVLDFSRVDEGENWSESDIDLATLVASLLTGGLDRHLMETQLWRLSSIVESSPQFILYIADSGAINYVNPAAEAITGYAETELINGGLGIVFDEQTVQAIKEVHIPNTLQNGTDNFEIELIRKDGQKRIMAFSSFITESNRTNVGCIASDVTEMRELEGKLISAKDLAEQGSRAKSDFLSRMSHEMRTPMNAIIGMTNIAKGSEDSSKKEYCLDQIDNASRHLLGVINDILDMSKIEVNKFTLSFVDFSFEQMLRNVLDVVNFRVIEKAQNLSVYIDPAMPAFFTGDEQRLAQVITNLLANAIKFTDDQGLIQLRASVLRKEAGVFTVQIEVSDSGIGISPEQQQKLFRSFEQADGSIARKFGGTGLGLAISRRIIELMGGEIWVVSELGKGSTFAFTTKIKACEGSAESPLPAVLRTKNLNVMVIDDSPEVCEYFKHMMDVAGISCTAALDGRQALEILRDLLQVFDIVFIDWRMPGMDGIELTRELRKLARKQPAIIMISAAEWNDIRDEAIAAGVDDFVPKPLFPSFVMSSIDRYTGGTTVNKAEEEKAAVVAQTYDSKTVLMAEDVAINREIIISVLEDSKLKFECAENGREAIDMFAANPGKYDIIFMDMHMPEVDGLEATRQIRALEAPQGSRVPIIAMTANVFREDIEKCMEAGMDDHIGKPIDFDILYAKLKKYLGDY